jgi:hypothetical protein
VLLLDGHAKIPTDAKTVQAISEQLGRLLLNGITKR